MIPLLLFLLFSSFVINIILIFRIKKIKNENLNTFRDKLKQNDTCLLQEWDDTLDKCKMLQVTVIHKGSYSIRVIDENMKYHIVYKEDLFPINYHVCRDN